MCARPFVFADHYFEAFRVVKLLQLVDNVTFTNSLIIHKEIKQSYQRIGSRAYTFKTGKYTVSLIGILYTKMVILISILYIKNTN